MEQPFPIGCGGVAQLGERLLRMQEVRSSILLISTTLFFENYTEEEERNSCKYKRTPNVEKHSIRKLRYKGHTVDALAKSADEGRDQLRKAAVSRK